MAARQGYISHNIIHSCPKKNKNTFKTNLKEVICRASKKREVLSISDRANN
jgi:hypothetical protein